LILARLLQLRPQTLSLFLLGTSRAVQAGPQVTDLSVQLAQFVYEAAEHLGGPFHRFFGRALGRRNLGCQLVYGLPGDLPPTALRVPFPFDLSALEFFQEAALGDLE
jgi:hypothetical protein